MSAAAAELPPELYGAMGRFVSGYCEVEVQVQLMFINYCGVEFLTGRALVGEQGTHDVLDRTKRVIRARNLDKRILDDVESIHAEISKLTELRNKVVHRTLRGTATAPGLVNHVRARDLAALTVEPLAVEGLKQGTTQAERVCDRVRKHIL